jgi:hypothetical protein
MMCSIHINESVTRVNYCVAMVGMLGFGKSGLLGRTITVYILDGV